SPILIILCFYLFGLLREKWGVRTLRLVVVCVRFLAIFNLLVASTAQTRITTRRGVMYSYRADPVLKYLNAHIQPGEEIFAYPYRPMYYFLLGARNATRYSFIMRGFHTEAQLREAVGALETKKVRHVIWDNTFDHPGTAWAFPHKPKSVQIIE